LMQHICSHLLASLDESTVSSHPAAMLKMSWMLEHCLVTSRDEHLARRKRRDGVTTEKPSHPN
jgi:hypothetical protein